MLADTLERMARKERRIRNILSFLSKNLLNDSFNLESADDSHFNFDVETREFYDAWCRLSVALKSTHDAVRFFSRLLLHLSLFFPTVVFPTNHLQKHSKKISLYHEKLSHSFLSILRWNSRFGTSRWKKQKANTLHYRRKQPFAFQRSSETS